MGMSDGEVRAERELGNGLQGQAHTDNGSGSCEERFGTDTAYWMLDSGVSVRGSYFDPMGTRPGLYVIVNCDP